MVAAFRALGAYLRFRRTPAAFRARSRARSPAYPHGLMSWRSASRPSKPRRGASHPDLRAAAEPDDAAGSDARTGTSQRQVQKVLSYNALKTLSAARIGKIL